MKTLFLTALLLGLPPVALADTTFMWDHDGLRVDGFRLYQDDKIIATVTDPAAREVTVTLDLGDQVANFSATAYNALGESAHSESISLGKPVAPASFATKQ